MRLVLLGVRGSTPAPGSPFVRYGGHTSCVAVLNDSSSEPVLLLDAGTGIRDLPGLLGGAPFRGAVVLSHLHWDHVHGLPFCRALDHPDAQVDLWVPENPSAAGPAAQTSDPQTSDLQARDLLAGVMSPPHFPIGPSGLLGSWRFRLSAPGQLDLDTTLTAGARVTVAPVRHKGGTTFAVRVDLDGASVGYVPDHTLAPGDDLGLVDAAAAQLLHGVDLLLHDGQFAGAAEARLAADYGHCTIEDALCWADACAAGRVVLTHHGPGRTDDQLDTFAGRFQWTPGGRPVSFAVQGSVLDVVPAS